MNLQPTTEEYPHSTDPSDAEAVIEALRVAIGQSSHDADPEPDLDEEPEPEHEPFPPPTEVEPEPEPVSGLSTNEKQILDKAMIALTQLSATNQSILDNMNLTGMLQGLAGSLKLLVESNRRQGDIVRNLVIQLGGGGHAIPIDPALTSATVPRHEYEALKLRYDALLHSSTLATATGSGSGSGRKPRVTKQSMNNNNTNASIAAAIMNADADMEVGVDRSRELSMPIDLGGGRKKRSMKLEHLVHKMANRRLGVEYQVNGFQTPGTRDLPDPQSHAPDALESINAVDEFRPDFRTDVTSVSVEPYIEKVVEDCWQAWETGVGDGEEGVDRKKLKDSVTVYWLRLCKRWDEQLTREKGEVHKDELTRRKQNQYRRQQSLVARRLAAFDQSPLAACKLRALYRTLLTIDFAAPTLERPDPNRKYSDDEWYAYQKLAGGRPGEAHEIVEVAWMSSNCRALLSILDVSAIDQNARSKRKGRPKAPLPTFHLPSHLWDSTRLPLLRAKDGSGLPVSGAQGIILFNFHVDEQFMRDHPVWAEGLYDNPPVPDEDAHLPSLGEVLNTTFVYLKARIKVARHASLTKTLSPEEIAEINSRPMMNYPQTSTLDDFEEGLSPIDYSSALNGAATAGLDSFMATNTTAIPTSPSPFLTSGLGGSVMSEAINAGPSPGSSIRARKLAKRDMSFAPGGAATPVPKKRKMEEGSAVDGELEGDRGFLESL